MSSSDDLLVLSDSSEPDEDDDHIENGVHVSNYLINSDESSEYEFTWPTMNEMLDSLYSNEDSSEADDQVTHAPDAVNPGSEPNSRRTSSTHQASQATDTVNPSSAPSTRRSSSSHQVHYDPDLPAQHTYLGPELQEVNGNRILEDGATVTIPLLTIESVVLVPGQTLPLVVRHPLYVSTLRSISQSNQLFGIYKRCDFVKMSQLIPGAEYNVGTTAEIRNYFEEEYLRGTRLKLKVVGRQRFRVEKTWYDENGILMGNCQILPEVHEHGQCDLGQQVFGRVYGEREKKMRAACTSLPSFVYEMYDSYVLVHQLAEKLSSWTRTTDFSSRSLNANRDNPSTSQVRQREEVQQTVADTDLQSPTASTERPENRVQITRTVVTRVRESSQEDELDRSRESPTGDLDYCAPSTPGAFSYWIISNLPVDDFYRMSTLYFNSAIQRLRFESSILDLCLNIFCKNCGALFCRRDDVFSMSVVGPQGTYVNENGMVFDLFTVYKATSLVHTGKATTHFTWFPGYAWTIAQCSTCRIQIGFKFTATDKSLRPEDFWGLTRSKVNSWKNRPNQALVF